ncbi:MAG: ion transporter [Saprospiraceae bacterium]
MGLKDKIFQVLDGGKKEKTLLNKRIDFLITALIIFSVFSIILESYAPLREQFGIFFFYFEFFTIMFFSLEYILRVWIADLKYPDMSRAAARWRFIRSPMGIVDLVAILPFYLPFLFTFDLRFIRILRVVRLLRVLKLKRHSKALNIIVQVFYDKRSELSITLFVTFILLLISSSIMYNLENEAQPDKFPDIISTFWWAIATLTTVGYGDVYPITPWGKFVGGIIALLGIGMVALPTGIISAAFIDELDEGKKKYRYCPHCGEKLEE